MLKFSLAVIHYCWLQWCAPSTKSSQLGLRVPLPHLKQVTVCGRYTKQPQCIRIKVLKSRKHKTFPTQIAKEPKTNKEEDLFCRLVHCCSFSYSVVRNTTAVAATLALKWQWKYLRSHWRGNGTQIRLCRQSWHNDVMSIFDSKGKLLQFQLKKEKNETVWIEKKNWLKLWWTFSANRNYWKSVKIILMAMKSFFKSTNKTKQPTCSRNVFIKS